MSFQQGNFGTFCRYIVVGRTKRIILSLSLQLLSDYFLVYLLADLFSNSIVVADDYSVPVH
jgi:hypothetical protein